MSSQKNFHALVEEKLLKIDDLAGNMDIISLHVDFLKLLQNPTIPTTILMEIIIRFPLILNLL